MTAINVYSQYKMYDNVVGEGACRPPVRYCEFDETKCFELKNIVFNNSFRQQAGKPEADAGFGVINATFFALCLYYSANDRKSESEAAFISAV